MKFFKLIAGLFVLTGLLLLAGRSHFYRKPQHREPSTGLANTTILIIRHAEKPDDGPGLTPTGQRHARAYVHYFQNFKVDGQPLRLSHLFAAADSRSSARTRLTLEPLSHASGLPIDVRFKNKECVDLAKDLQAHNYGQHILICWHHGEIPDLLDALGADSDTLLPHGRWPSEVYNWVLELRYDGNGTLMPGATRRLIS